VHEVRSKYSNVRLYNPETITSSMFARDRTFSSNVLSVKRDLLLTHCKHKTVLDLGCADGRHLREIASNISFGIGLDFSIPFIERAIEASSKDRSKNLCFLVGDVRALPLESSSVECAYSFATLYYLDEMKEAYAELHRVLTPGGVAILELGNSRSLATIVSRQYPDLPGHSRQTVTQHLRAIKMAGFRLTEWRSFQILPFWGARPRWLQVLRLPVVERLAMTAVKGRMIDEWVSSSLALKRFAFRHLMVVEKVQ
jgi:ubiquinone/menaquinone biosynthesis C-methylase UbiE